MSSFGWFDEIVEMLIARVVFLGAALRRENEHFVVVFLPDYLKGKRAGSLARGQRLAQELIRRQRNI